MTILELKKLIERLPDEMEVGTTDHYGDYVKVDIRNLRTSDVEIKKKVVTILRLPVIDIGEEPD